MPPAGPGGVYGTPVEFEIDGTDLAAYWRRAMDKGSLVDQTRVVRCIRTHFKLTDDTEKLLGVFECCKGETPDDSGDMFVFSNHLCFRKDAAATTARGSYGASDTAPSKFAVPMPSILDARVNPGVYPFGAVVVTIDGLRKPWIFSFFTERETAVKCVRSARGWWSTGDHAGARVQPAPRKSLREFSEFSSAGSRKVETKPR
jgi:hypothetical protein